MALSTYFKGRSGRIFWLNAAAAVMVLIAAPLIAFYTLGIYTNHGEKIEVPSVIGKSAYEAGELIDQANLRAVISDSIYSAGMPPGSILEQRPAAGATVKSGHIVYLTVNLGGQPSVRFPDLSGNSSLREAEMQLRELGFRLTECERVKNEPKDLVIAIRQGIRELHAGDMVSRERPLTILAGAGINDSLELDTSTYATPETAADFDIEL